MNILLPVYTLSEVYDSECKTALVNITPDLVKEVIERFHVVDDLAKMSAFYCLEFWDGRLDYGQTDEVELAEDFVFVADDLKIECVRTDVERMRVTKSDVIWVCNIKNTDIVLETCFVPRAQWEEWAKEFEK